jgi:hypothetical protein
VEITDADIARLKTELQKKIARVVELEADIE